MFLSEAIVAKDLLPFHEYHYRGLIGLKDDQGVPYERLNTHLDALLHCKMPACEAHRIAEGLTELPTIMAKIGLGCLVGLTNEVIKSLKDREDEIRVPVEERELHTHCFDMIGG